MNERLTWNRIILALYLHPKDWRWDRFYDRRSGLIYFRFGPIEITWAWPDGEEV